ncbi:hypothetical protein BDF21DRAFT_229791 [Thamnidium elegans]|nr:hypothetical protein BDF21DRAFT_229791 [Thamnidium elegans]
MDKVYELHQHTHCVAIYIEKSAVTTYIFSTSNRHFHYSFFNEGKLGSSISYNKEKTYVKALGRNCGEEDEDNLVINNFRDGLHNLFQKDKETWEEEDKFLMKAVSDYLPLAVKNTVKKKNGIRNRKLRFISLRVYFSN